MVNITTFDMNLLRILDALLQEGSTVKAGARIGLSQPAVSAALARLRQTLGDELFIRHGQGLEPTDYARSLAIPLREALDQLEALLSGPDTFDPKHTDVTFKISGSDFFAELLMPKLANRLSTLAPGIRVQQVDLVPDGHVELLKRHEAEIALIPTISFPDWIEHRPVFSSRFLVIARGGHQRIAGAGISPLDVIPIDLFCDLGHVLFSPEGNLRGLGDAALANIGRERQVKITVPVFSGVYTAVSESDLVALLPDQLAHYIAPKLGLCIYQPPMPIDEAMISMIWHRRSSANPTHKWLRDLVAEILLPLNEGYAPLPG